MFGLFLTIFLMGLVYDLFKVNWLGLTSLKLMLILLILGFLVNKLGFFPERKIWIKR